MKKLFLIVLSVLLVFTGCNNDTKTPATPSTKITDITLDYSNVERIITLDEAKDWTETGLTVTASFSDGTSAALDSNNYTVDKSAVTGATETGEKTVTVKASSFTSTFTVEVVSSTADIMNLVTGYFTAFPSIPTSADQKMTSTLSFKGTFTNASYSIYGYSSGTPVVATTKTITSNGEISYSVNGAVSATQSGSGTGSLNGTFSITTVTAATATTTTTNYVAQNLEFEATSETSSEGQETTTYKITSGTVTKDGTSIADNQSELTVLMNEVTMISMNLPQGTQGVSYTEAPSSVQTLAYTITDAKSSVTGYEDLTLSGLGTTVSPLASSSSFSYTSDINLTFTPSTGKSRAVILKGSVTYTFNEQGVQEVTEFKIDTLTLDGTAIDTSTIETGSELYQELLNWVTGSTVTSQN